MIALLIIQGCNTPQKASTNNKESEESVIDNQAENTMEIATSFMEAMGSGDMEKMVSLMHEDMVWQNEGDTTLPWIGPWNGKQAILEEFMPLFGANFQTTLWNTEDAISSGNTAAFFGRMSGRLIQSNQQTEEFTFALRVKVKDDKIILWNWLEDSYEVSRAYQNN